MPSSAAASPVRVVVADDHPVIRAGLRHILDGQEGIDVVGEVQDGPSVIQMVREMAPDVVVMDVSMPRMNGIDALRALRRDRPRTRVVMLSVHYSETIVLAALEAGAAAYVLKDAASDELCMAVRAVGRGHGYLSPPLAQVVTTSLSAGSSASTLTSRERQVVQLLGEGTSLREAAASLFVSVPTVKTHRMNAMRKIGARTTADLVRYAIREGLSPR
jgi:DNA-binding NarL/FixJ family response regulator